MLSDRDIAYELDRVNMVFPLPSSKAIQPASVDLRLGSVRGNRDQVKPLKFKLASTLETIHLPPHIGAMVAGKSSLARIGLVVESAGFVDPGFHGQITLELFNMSDRKIKLKVGMAICQIVFFYLNTLPERTYGHPDLGSHYQNQRGPTESWMSQKT